jgi:hypothetical protein
MSIKVSMQLSILRLSGVTAPEHADDKARLADWHIKKRNPS